MTIGVCERMIRPPAVVTVLAGAMMAWLAVFAGPAFAGWSAAQRISGPFTAGGMVTSYPQIGTDAHGNAVAAWTQLQGSSSPMIMVATKPARGEAWTTPAVLSIAGQAADYPHVAVAASGAAVAIWQASDAAGAVLTGPSSDIEASVKRAGSDAWSSPVQISSAQTYAEGPQVAVDNHGDAIAIWATQATGVSRVQASTFSFISNTWSTPTDLASSKHPLTSLQLAIDGRGEAIAVWRNWLGGALLSPKGTIGEIEAASRPAGSDTWRRPVRLGRELESPSQLIGTLEPPGPQIAMDANGSALVVWQGGRSVQHFVTDVSTWSASSRRWQPEAPVAKTFASSPHIATSPAGYATVVWIAADGGIEAASSKITGCCWTRPTTLTAQLGPALYPRIAIDRSGEALASWSRPGGTIQATMRAAPPSGPWQHPIELGATNGGDSQEAFGSNGSAILIWGQPGEPVGNFADNFVDVATYTR